MVNESQQQQIYSAPRPPLRVTLRGQTALAAGGDFDDPSVLTVINVSGQKVWTPYFFYQATGIGGAFSWKFEWSLDGQGGWAQGCDIQSVGNVTGTPTLDTMQSVTINYGTETAGAEVEGIAGQTFLVGGPFIRINVQETGLTDAPGTCMIQLYAQSV